MSKPVRSFSLYVLVLALTLALYVPFRLVADRYQVITVAGTDNFYYPFATFIWPLFTLVMGAAPAYFGSLLRIPIYIRIPVYFLLLGSWDELPRLDDLLGVQGFNYLSSYDHPGELNTTYVSFVLQPVCYVLGILSGEIAGWETKRSLTNNIPVGSNESA